MTEIAAIKAAIGLFHLPSNVRLLRSEPLPAGIEVLLRSAAGDEAVSDELAELLDRPASLVRQAAEFYIEQILLDTRSDHYRVLGSMPNASSQELRRHMALLMTWLHPDRHPNDIRAVFAARVAVAWDNLRTFEKRQIYDASLHRTTAPNPARRAAPPRIHGGRSDRSYGLSTAAWQRSESGFFARCLGRMRRILRSRSNVS